MRKPRPYIDRGKPGALRYQGDRLLTVNDPEQVDVRRLKLEEIQRHNSMEPELLATHRILLRWSEGGGSGLPNPEAEIREMHYDPLPPDLQERVDGIVDKSPWRNLIVKRYRTALDLRTLAEELGISRATMYADLRVALWYCRGRFETARIYG